jgi:RNA recognition motif-containing protein
VNLIKSHIKQTWRNFFREMLERDALGGNGPTGTKVREDSKGKGPAVLINGAEGRRVSFRYLDSSTSSFFFTKFPDNAKNSDLRKLFSNYGQVAEVFIPQKVDKWGRKFGFVKFNEVEDLADLEARLEDVWLWQMRLKVNKARFSREDKQGEGGRKSREEVESGGSYKKTSFLLG